MLDYPLDSAQALCFSRTADHFFPKRAPLVRRSTSTPPVFFQPFISKIGYFPNTHYTIMRPEKNIENSRATSAIPGNIQNPGDFFT